MIIVRPAVPPETNVIVAKSPTVVRSLSTRRNPALDALRSLAIIMVVNYHAAAMFAPSGNCKRLLTLGYVGVELFFVLETVSKPL